MNKVTIAIPSVSMDGLTGIRSDHFGHCPVFTLVDLQDNQISGVRTVKNVAHEVGGCLKPVAMLADLGVTTMVAVGMGRGPFQKMAQHGITVYFADLATYPDVQSAITAFTNGKLPEFIQDQLCNGSGNCHH
ncbi:MAG: dinitrogenase iron-molybdenum cofactor biosynthesis protein [Proteobacteria bacterium]|nr:dinitrogenase iron-molybdenum cofactor biosynthesis protein [Pseudomonadota bacterium]MBU1688394.1 dinitrogenase iron-molybdenum cofactor biosynthesis protein [Pseudomonadota bacterium]